MAAHPRPDTGELVADVIDNAAGAAPGATLEERYQHSMITLADHIKGSGNGAPPKPPFLPNHPWLRGVFKWAIAGIFTAGMVFAAMKLGISNNEKAINDHAAKPMHDKAAKEIGEIRRDVAGVKADVGSIKNTQTAISDGIKELKKERVEELKEELKAERRRNRRNGRGD